jgi:hypothetical protein
VAVTKSTITFLRACPLDTLCGHLGEDLLSYPVYEILQHRVVRRIERARFRRGRGDAGLLLDVLDHVEQHLGRPQIGGGGFVDQLMGDRLALGDLAAFSVDRNEDRLARGNDQQRMKFLLLRPPGLPDRSFLRRVRRGGLR